VKLDRPLLRYWPMSAEAMVAASDWNTPSFEPPACWSQSVFQPSNHRRSASYSRDLPPARRVVFREKRKRLAVI